MGVPKRLTEKQMKFAELVVSNEGRKTGTECALEAGYEPERARITAKRGAHSAAANAEVARGKAAGLYIEQKIIRTGKLDDLSAEELETRLKSVLNEYSPILEGVEVEDLKKDVKDKVKKSRIPNLKKLN